MSVDSEPVVVIDRLTKKYGDFVALDKLSLRLDRGQILGFIGPNGAGKTTTIKVLVGQLRPSSGSAQIAGADCASDPEIKRLVGYMPDTFGSYDGMRVWEYLDFFGAAFSIPRAARVKRIGAVMETTGSTYMKDRFVETLSHGMKQRVALARTLLHDPPVLILDEPAGGLDPQARIEMRDTLLRLAASGKTLIVTSHILPELARVCDRVAIITHGKLRAFGTVAQIMRTVTQERLIEIQLASAEQLARAAEVIRLHAGAEVEVTTSVAECMVRFRTRMTEDAAGELLARLIQAGVRVNQFREVQADLEETFLTITHGELPSGDRESAAPAPLPSSNKKGARGAKPAH
jgi:ABC-2 type transport system ATP-binding protein